MAIHSANQQTKVTPFLLQYDRQRSFLYHLQLGTTPITLAKSEKYPFGQRFIIFFLTTGDHKLGCCQNERIFKGGFDQRKIRLITRFYRKILYRFESFFVGWFSQQTTDLYPNKILIKIGQVQVAFVHEGFCITV